MPIPKPRKGDSKNTYISKVVKQEMAAGRPQKQAIAIAEQAWEDAKSKKKG